MPELTVSYGMPLWFIAFFGHFHTLLLNICISTKLSLIICLINTDENSFNVSSQYVISCHESVYSIKLTYVSIYGYVSLVLTLKWNFYIFSNFHFNKKLLWSLIIAPCFGRKSVIIKITIIIKGKRALSARYHVNMKEKRRKNEMKSYDDEKPLEKADSKVMK